MAGLQAVFARQPIHLNGLLCLRFTQQKGFCSILKIQQPGSSNYERAAFLDA